MIARNKCKKAEDTSDLNSQSDSDILKKRKRSQRLDSSEEESLINSSNDMPTLPRIQGLFQHSQFYN